MEEIPMFKKVYNFFKTGGDKPVIQNEALIKKMYERRRWSVFISITLGYGLFYVARLCLSVVKKPMLEQGILNAREMGIMGSALFFAYAFGKFFNGFLSDRFNVKKFMSLGLLISALTNLFLGFTNFFIFFVILWGINGWFQSMGAAPSVVAIANWFSDKERGTRYGIWSASHNIGGALTYVLTSVVVSVFGWRWGFIAPGLLCVFGAIAFYLFMFDRPQTYGLPPIADYKHDHGLKIPKKESTWELQKEVLKNPAVWMLGLASASFYIVRYAIESWGIVYLGMAKGYTTIQAGSIISSSPIIGILGTVSCGYLSDRLFNGRRNSITLILGIVFSICVVAFVLIPPGYPLLHVICMGVYGFCLGALLTFLGGLMAVDICSKRAAGAAMGVIGLFSYLAAAAQDLISGFLIESHKIIVNGQPVYNFKPAIIFWISASVFSFLFAATVWNVKHKD
jgi:OPA family sugar phosphate sensor protein UhpC-like MFS transporter